MSSTMINPKTEFPEKRNKTEGNQNEKEACSSHKVLFPFVPFRLQLFRYRLGTSMIIYIQNAFQFKKKKTRESGEKIEYQAY